MSGVKVKYFVVLGVDLNISVSTWYIIRELQILTRRGHLFKFGVSVGINFEFWVSRIFCPQNRVSDEKRWQFWV